MPCSTQEGNMSEWYRQKYRMPKTGVDALQYAGTMQTQPSMFRT